MTHCSSKSIHVLNKSTIITNTNVKEDLSFVQVIQTCNHCYIKSIHVLNKKILIFIS